MIRVGTYARIVPNPRSFQRGSPWAGQIVVVIGQSADQHDMVLVLRDPAGDDTWSHYRAHDRQGVYADDLEVVTAVEGRESADSAEWLAVDYVEPYEVDDLNRQYGWDRYRIVTAEPHLSLGVCRWQFPVRAGCIPCCCQAESADAC